MKHLLLAIVLAPVMALTSCAPLAVAGFTIVITDDWKDNALTADVNEDVDVVWASVRSSVAEMTDALLHVDEQQGVAGAERVHRNGHRSPPPWLREATLLPPRGQ